MDDAAAAKAAKRRRTEDTPTPTPTVSNGGGDGAAPKPPRPPKARRPDDKGKGAAKPASRKSKAGRGGAPRRSGREKQRAAPSGPHAINWEDYEDLDDALGNGSAAASVASGTADEEFDEEDFDNDGDDGDVSEDDDFIEEDGTLSKRTSAAGGRGRSGGGAARGVRINDEFHSMNNGLSNFPEEQRTQDGVGPHPVAVRVPEWGLDFRVPSDAMALALQVYTVVRGFSWQLRLSPFPFEALLAAVVADDDSALRDEIHICLLRALAWHDSKAQRAARKLPLATLDAHSWKDHLWEQLRYLHCFDWWRQHVISRRPEPPLVGLATGAPPAAAPTRAPPGEMPPPATGRDAWLAYVRRLNTMDTTPDELIMRDYEDLEVADRFALLNLLCDVLLEQPHVRDEVERRVLAQQWHAGDGGEGGAGAMVAAEGRAARREAEAAGKFAYETYGCVLCTLQDGQITRCDACSAAYHMRCLGQRVAPGAAWLCPECAAGGRGETAGVRIPMAAMQPGRIPLYLLMGNLLRMPHPGQKVVEEDEDMVDCGLEWLQGDAALAAMDVAKRKSGPDGCHASALAALTRQCSADAAGEAGGGGERITPPACTPWTYENAYRHSWPEAARVLQKAVEDSKKLKRRGTPNVVVFAGITLPQPFDFPLLMSHRHVQFLAALQEAYKPLVAARAAAAAASDDGDGVKAEVKAEDGKEAHADENGAEIDFPRDHAALKAPDGYMSLFRTLQEYLLRLEYNLWGVLDQGWGKPGLEYRKRWCIDVLQAQTPQLLARCMLVLYDAIRPSVAKQLLSSRWSYMDTEIVPGGVAVLDAAARAAAARVEETTARHEAKLPPQAAYIGRTTARSAAAAAEAAEAAAAAAAREEQKAEGRVRDRDRSRRRRADNDSDDEPLEPLLAIPFADAETGEAPESGIRTREPIVEFGRVVTEDAPVLQTAGFAGKDSTRDPNSSNRRKRKYGKRPVKAQNAPVGAAAASAAAAAAAKERKAEAAGGAAPTPAADGDAAAPTSASAMSQRRKYIMHLAEARSIGKRPAPQFTNYLYFDTQSARMQPMERLPHREVVRSGRQGGRVAIAGMMYPRLTTSSEAVARLALTSLKWRGLLENCVSAGQVAVAFRELEEALNVDKVSRERLHSHECAPLAQCRILERCVVANPNAPPDAPEPLYLYRCQLPPPAQHAQSAAPPHMAGLASNGFAPPPHHHHHHAQPQPHSRGGGSARHDGPEVTGPDGQPAARSLEELQARAGAPTWVVETALPLAFIKAQEEAYRGGSEYPPPDSYAEEVDDWLYAGGNSSGGHARGRPSPAAQQEPSKSTDSASEALASRRSRRNVGRKVYYDDEDADVAAALDAQRGRGAGGAGPAGAWPEASHGGSASARAQRAGARGRASGAWVSRAVHALGELMSEPNAPPFNEPVPREVPFYHDIIKRPMDFGTVYGRLQQGKYGAPGEVFADMALVWANCRQFNEPDSEIAVAARQLEVRWNQLCTLQELLQLAAADAAAGGDAAGAQPGVEAAAAQLAAQAQAQQQALLAQQQQQQQLVAQQQALLAQQQREALLRQQQAAQSAAAAAAPAQQPAQQMMSQQALAQMQAMAAVLSKLRTYDLAEPFLEPVPRDVPGYYEQIASPIDLGTIWTQLTQGRYPSASHVHADVQRMFTNCYTFNLEGSDIYRVCQQTEAMYRRLCRDAGLM